ncbi:hypothetical protein N9165_02670 [Akkermansiaceae bacterium]|nr:hypothetical protein [Akkermansiaceae bacterium]
MMADQDCRTPRLPHSSTTALLDYRTPRLPHSSTAALLDYRTPRLPRSSSPALPDSHTSGKPLGYEDIYHHHLFQPWAGGALGGGVGSEPESR